MALLFPALLWVSPSQLSEAGPCSSPSSGKEGTCLSSWSPNLGPSESSRQPTAAQSDPRVSLRALAEATTGPALLHSGCWLIPLDARPARAGDTLTLHPIFLQQTSDQSPNSHLRLHCSAVSPHLPLPSPGHLQTQCLQWPRVA